MAENIQKIKTRYPFGGFYLELLPEAERKELESMPEEVLLPESPTTTELPNTVPPAESAAIKPVPQPAIEIVRPETTQLPAPAKTLNGRQGGGPDNVGCEKYGGNDQCHDGEDDKSVG